VKQDAPFVPIVLVQGLVVTHLSNGQTVCTLYGVPGVGRRDYRLDTAQVRLPTPTGTPPAPLLTRRRRGLSRVRSPRPAAALGAK
jgi:hypothetical protein